MRRNRRRFSPREARTSPEIGRNADDLADKNDLQDLSDYFLDVAGDEGQARQVFDLPAIELQITDHRLINKVCPSCGHTNMNDFSAPRRQQPGGAQRSDDEGQSEGIGLFPNGGRLGLLLLHPQLRLDDAQVRSFDLVGAGKRLPGQAPLSQVTFLISYSSR